MRTLKNEQDVGMESRHGYQLNEREVAKQVTLSSPLLETKAILSVLGIKRLTNIK